MIAQSIKRLRPHLERDGAKPDLLAEILKPRATRAATVPSAAPVATTAPAGTPRPIDKPQTDSPAGQP